MPADPVYRSPAARDAVFAAYDRALAAWPVPYATVRVPTAFGQTHVVLCGDEHAPPLVLLHGGGGSAIDWRWNVEPLSRRFRLVLPDIPGEPGKTAGARPAYASGNHAAWLGEVLRELGLARVRLGGASLGSWIAWQYALRHPEAVSHLAVLCPPHLAPMRPGFLLRAIGTAVFPTDAMLRRFQRAVMSPATPAPDEQAMADFIVRWRAQRRNPPPIPPASDAEVRALPRESLVLVGEDEPLYDVQIAVRRFSALGRADRLRLIPAAGHALPYEQADRVNEMLAEFLEAAPAREVR